MTVGLAIVALLLGSVIVLGQLVSVVDFPRAQRLGLQEKEADTDTVYRHLELNTARWDLAVLWTLPLAAAVMLAGASWWPWVALIAGGILVDAGGREVSKILALRAEQIRVGAPEEARNTLAFLVLMAAVGLALVVHSLVVLA